MGKKNDSEDLEKVVSKLIKDVGEDRGLLLDFLKNLIESYQGEQAVGVAEYVAKLADALTRQNQVRVATIKALAKSQPIDDEQGELDELQKQIGLPFEDDSDLDEGSN